MGCSRLHYDLIVVVVAVTTCLKHSPIPWVSSLSFSATSMMRAQYHHHNHHQQLKYRCNFMLRSSFYDDFEDFVPGEKPKDDDDDDNDDDYKMTQEDKARIDLFRSQMKETPLVDNLDNDTKQDNGDEEEDEDDDDEDDEDDEATTDKEESNIGKSTIFSSVEDLIAFAAASGGQQGQQQEWAIPLINDDDTTSSVSTINTLQAATIIANALKGGVVLLANPQKFCSNNINKQLSKNQQQQQQQPSPSLLSKFGLTMPPPSDLGPDRRADLLPVLLLLERHPLRGSKAVLLNRRTGYLLGDLEQQQPGGIASQPAPKLGAFMIQPLWFGGTSAGINTSGGGLDMLHPCPLVKGCQKLTDDGLFWGGDIMQAQEAMVDTTLERPLTGFDFKFFVQSTRWLPTQLEREVRDGTWFLASVSKDVLFKPRDRLGTMRAKPLWTEIMELMGGNYLKIRNNLYEE